MALKDLLKINFVPAGKGNGKTTKTDAEVVAEVYSLTAAAGLMIGTTAIQAALYQDDDAHDTCSLTACLNPLHPGPCKGWKGTLHSVSPGAWHTLEAARVEKANTTRIKKIEALKAQGKPIPHKLLTPIVAKPHPNAGKTANAATGEAHAAGKAVSDAAGVHVNEPGKVTLGQASKTIGPVEKGPKGKKPTLASKGIAFVIAQPKVTDQYKLEKAGKITPEQWNDLPAEDKATIRGELAKVQKDGFGPQQKKATELLDQLPAKGLKGGGTDTVTTPKGQVIQKIEAKPETLSDKVAKVKEEMSKGTSLSESIKKVTGKEPVLPETEIPNTASPLGTQKLLKKVGSLDVTYAKGTDYEKHFKDVGLTGDHEHLLVTEGQGNWYITDKDGKKLQFLSKSGGVHLSKPESKASTTLKSGDPGTITTPSGKVYQKISLKQINEGPAETHPSPVQTPKLGDTAPPLKKGSTDQHGIYNKPHVGGEVKTTSVGLPSGYKISKDSMGYSLTHNGKLIRTSSTQEALEKYAHDHASGNLGGHQPSLGDTLKQKAAGLTPGAPGTITTPKGHVFQKVELKPEAAAKPKPLSPHVQHAIAMAKGHAVGASWSKNHLAAYQPLSAEEFHALPQDVKDKITQELHKSLDKFLDPKKKAAAQALLDKFGAAKKADVAPKAPKIENVDFDQHLHDFSVTDAQAKQVVDSKAIAHLAAVAKNVAGVTYEDNPDTSHPLEVAKKAASMALAKKIQIYDDDVINEKPVKDAMKAFKTAEQNLAHAKNVGVAKEVSYNKISAKLATDTGSLSPIEKAALVKYRAYLLNGHPVPTDPATMHSLQVAADNASENLNETLQSTAKQLNAPSAADMSPMVLTDAAKKLLGEEAVQPKINLTLAEAKNAKASAEAQVNGFAAKYPPGVVTDPNVAAAKKALEQDTMQLLATKASQQKLDDHLNQHHMAALMSDMDVNGNQLMSSDKKIISAHAKMISDNASYLDNTLAQQEPKVKAAQDKFTAEAQKAEASHAPAELHALTDYDKATIEASYAGAWAQPASKAVLYGVKTYAQKQQMKSDAQYPSLVADLSDLNKLAGKLALAHAEEHTAEQNVPIDYDTGAKLPGPENVAWLAKTLNRTKLEKEFASLHKTAQARLDHIRVSAGLKKRALPKADAPAVKAAAAESGFHKTGGYSGPNYGKPAKAKHYMLAKVGPKHAVVHQSPGEKKAQKLSETVTPSKIENEPSTPAAPVSLGSDSAIWHIPAMKKKTITSDFKAMPKGKYLQDPTEDIFDNLVTLAAAHSDPGMTLSVDQILKTIDETHAKNLGVDNGGMLHKKVTDWLATPAGKKYAEGHSTPDTKAVKQLKGEVELPKGVTLEPGEKVQKVAGPGAFDDNLTASSFKAITAEQAKEKQDAYMKAQGVKWTQDQKSAIKAYTGNGHGSYSTFNDYLRGEGSGTASTKLSVINIQAAMMPLQEHWLLKRGTGWPPELSQYKSNPHVLVGQTFEDPAFTSSTVAGSSGHFSGKPLQLIIEAPKGTVGAFINGISQYKGTENEYLLAAGSKFKVISVEVKGGQTFMRVRVVGGK